MKKDQEPAVALSESKPMGIRETPVSKSGLSQGLDLGSQKKT